MGFIEQTKNGGEADSSDDELKVAKDMVRGTNTKLFEWAKQLQKDAVEGTLSMRCNGAISGNIDTQAGEAGFVSEYQDSEGDIHTLGNSGDENEDDRKRRGRGLLVSDDTDFTDFVWKVGLRFPSRETFRSDVGRFAITCGRNLYFATSNRRMQGRMEGKCNTDCPFRLFAS